MRHFKRALGVTMTIVMILALTLTASAADPGSITITAPNEEFSFAGVTFNAYCIFNLKLVGGEYEYTINSDFANFEFDYAGGPYKGEALRQFLSNASNSTEGMINAAIVETLTSQIAEHVEDNGITAAGTVDGATTEGQIDSATITGLELGYYVVIPSGELAALPILTLLSVDKASSDITIKADAPTIDKAVQDNEGEGDRWGNVAEYSIGDTVPFRLLSEVPSMAGYDSYIYTVHDQMSDGLDFDPTSVVVTVGTTELTVGTQYTVVTNPDHSDCTFHIVFNPAVLLGFDAGDDIEIYYEAELNIDAEIALDGNPNTVYLEYSNNPYRETDTKNTPKDEVIVYTFEFEVVKVNAANDLLDGAKFVLSREVDGQFALIDIVSNKITGWTDVEEDAIFTVNGKFIISGLDEGTYSLEEIEAPEGYNLLEAAIEFTILPTYVDDKLTEVIIYREVDTEGDPIPLVDTLVVNQVVEIVVLNSTGAIFPGTGGMGTTIFTVGGIVLMLGAAVVLVAKKKVSVKN